MIGASGSFQYKLSEFFFLNTVQECWVMLCRSRRMPRWNYLQELRQKFMIPHPICNQFFHLLRFLNQFPYMQTGSDFLAGFLPGSDWHCTVSTSIQKKGSLLRSQIAPMSSHALVCSLKDMTRMWARLVWTGIWAWAQGSSNWELCYQTWKNSSAGLWEFLWLNIGLNFLRKPWELHSAELLNSAAQAGSLCQLQVHL